MTCGQAGKWLLVEGPHGIRHMMMAVIAGVAAHEEIRVLDCGNQFDAYRIARLLQGKTDALDRISIARAFSCYQVVTLLEQSPSMAVTFIVLDILNTFEDDSVKIWERKRLLRKCLEQFNRLERYAGGVVSVSTPRMPSNEMTELTKMVEDAATDAYHVNVVRSDIEQLKLM